jgi:hypothetical protein
LIHERKPSQFTGTAAEPQDLTSADTLTLDDIIPGFHLAIAICFRQRGSALAGPAGDPFFSWT